MTLDHKAIKDILPLTTKESFAVLKKLIKENKKKLTLKDFQSGKILMLAYDAKDKSQTYDKTPLVMILKRNKSHTLAVNLHWAPVPLRIILVKFILDKNKNNIKNGKPLEMDFATLKPVLKKIGFSPVIRLYINKRIASTGVIIPDDQFMNAAKLKTETFTQGKANAETLYKKALIANKKYRETRKRRD